MDPHVGRGWDGCVIQSQGFIYSGEKKRESYLENEEEDASIRPLKSGCALVDTCIIAFYCRPGRQYGLEESVLFVDLSRVRTWVLTGGGGRSRRIMQRAPT